MEKGLSIRRHPLLVSFLDKWGLDNPGKIALIQGDQGRQWMYRQFTQQVDHFAERFWKAGLRPGDRLASFLGNKMENVAIMWACWRLGVAFIPLTNRHLSQDGESLFKLIGAKLTILSPNSAKLLHDQGLKFGHKAHQCWVFGSNRKSVPKYPALKFIGPYKFSSRRSWFRKKRPWLALAPDIHNWIPALVLYPYTHEGHFSPMLICFEHLAAQIHALSELTGLDKRSKTLVVSPLQSPESIILSLILPTILGGTAVLTDATSSTEWKSLVGRYQVNTLFTKSLELENMLDESLSSSGWSSLSRIFYPYPKSDASANSSLFCRKIGGITLKETGGYMALQHPKFPELYIPLSRISVREPLQANEKDGRELSPGEIGEVCVHPPMIHGGLLTEEGILSPKISRDGIFYTGLRGSLCQMEDQVFLKIEEEASIPLNVQMNPAA